MTESLIPLEYPSITLILSGGLGNQLFQWCAGDRLAKALGAELEIDPEYFITDPYRRNPLIFDLMPGTKTRKGIDYRMKASREIIDTQQTNDFIANLPSTTKYVDLRENLILRGYWQDSRIPTDRQLQAISEQLRKFLRGCDLTSARSNSMKTVAIHIRRHDYYHHGLCDPNYYLDAARGIQSVIKNCCFLIFGDEPNFARWLFSASQLRCQVVESGGALADLALMSICDAHIISNSTFSWWGARLSRAKHVIAPAPWSFIHEPSSYLIPEEWIVVPNSVFKFHRRERYVEHVVGRLCGNSPDLD